MKFKFKQYSFYICLSAFLFGAFLPFNTKMANSVLALFYVLCLVHYFRGNRPKIGKQTIKALRYSSLLLLASTIISLFVFFEFSNFSNAFGRRVTYALSPLLFLLLDKPLLKRVGDNALKGIVFGSVLSSLLLIGNIFNEYYYTRPLFSVDKDLFNFYHTSFYYTRILDLHPSYLGMYLLLALSALYFGKYFKNTVLIITMVLALFVSVIFINSRVILLLFILLNAYYLCYYIFKRTQSYLKTIGVSTLIFVVAISVLFFMFKSTYAYQRIVKESAWELSNEIGTNYNFKGKGDSRMARWIAASQLIKEQPIFGYGVFNERDVLQARYSEMTMTSSATERYNAHNQFLGFFIEGGVLSMLSLMVFFVGIFVYSLKNKDVIAVCFIVSVLFICLVENYMIRNSGIIFVSFFSTLFLFRNVNATYE